jgi:autotransporter translocation and assembly factor TamB
VGEDGQIDSQRDLTWRQRTAIAVAVFCALLIIFHRPLLLSLGHWLVQHYASKENLKLDFRLEGNVFTNLTIRNLHATPTGPSPVESVDADFVHADYSLLGLARHGVSNLLRNVEVRSARIVLDPAKRLKPRLPKPNERDELPSVFPERVRLADATLIIRDTPHDFIIEHADVDLDPKSSHELRIEKLQLQPGQNWSKITAQSSYSNRNLILRDLALGDDRIHLVNLDASHIDQKKLLLNLDSAVGGGKITGSAVWSETPTSLNSKIHLLAENVDAAALNKYATLPEGFLRGNIERLIIDGSGVLDSPRTWTGTVAAQIHNFRVQEAGFDRCVLQLSARDGVATLESADIVQGENQFHLRGSGELPANAKEFGRSPATLEGTAAAVDLQRATAGMPGRLTGSAQSNGKIEIKNGKISAELNVSADSVGFADGKLEKLSAKLTASKIMPAPGKQQAWFADLQSKVDLDVSNIRLRDYAADSVQGTFSSTNDLVKFERLLVKRNQNEMTVRGEYRLPADLQNIESQPARVELSLDAPELADYWMADSPDKISGPLQIDGQLEWKNGIGNGQLTISGSNLRMRNLVFHQLSGQGTMANSVLYLNDFTAALNERDFVTTNGTIDLRAPFHYNGKFSANVADLSTLKPLLRAYKNENELSGSFAVDWEGSGDAKIAKNSGKLKLNLEKGRYGNMKSLQAKVDASYSPDGLDVPIIFFGSDKMDFQAIAQAKGETLEISKIQLDQGQAKYAQGYVSIPLVWKNLGTSAPAFPPNGKVAVNFQSENIEIKKLFEDVGSKPVASGVVNVKFDAQGTLAKLDARLEVQGRDLRTARVPNFEPASFDLTAQAKDGQLAISGKLQQAKIQPLELTANLPFNAAKALREQKVADDTPVTAKVRLPRSSVNFLRQFAPQIEQLDGEAGLDVDVGGTIGHPVLTGSGDMTVNVARSNDVTLPALRDFSARLKFADNVLTVERFGGELSGGKFTLDGRVTFPKLTNANIDLHLKADSVLVTRSDTVTARADCDIKVTGPFTSASVTGNVALTNSQFLKNLDLIPIGLPGRPAPQPPSSRPDFSIPEPPFRDWKFDVTIKTKDPFLIRGTLANGGAISDLHLIGTGLHPGLQGLIRLENVEATLPFSRLEIAYGFLYFDPSDSLNPKIDLHGTSVIRDYLVHVYVYGPSLAPEAIFTSEPPLPQEEIISLLATGATREELTGNNNVLAGRAATLLVTQLYRKFFKKGQASKSNSMFDRLDVSFGTVDPRTQQKQATARLKLNEHFVLMGDVGVGGEWRGMVKYLLRFR